MTPTDQPLRREERRLVFFFYQALPYITAGLVIIGVAAAYWWAFRPMLSQQAIVDSFSYRRNVEQLSILTKQRADARAVLSQYEQFAADDRQFLAAVLPSQRQVPNIIAQVDAVVRASDLVLRSLSITEDGSNTESSGTIQTLALTLTIEAADHQQLEALLERLETNVRLIDVTSFRFNTESAGVTINARTYFYQ